jgi:hypothetical protein
VTMVRRARNEACDQTRRSRKRDGNGNRKHMRTTRKRTKNLIRTTRTTRTRRIAAQSRRRVPQ